MLMRSDMSVYLNDDQLNYILRHTKRHMIEIQQQIARRCAEIVCKDCADGKPVKNWKHGSLNYGLGDDPRKCKAAGIYKEFGLKEEL